ncbi:CRISPR-associated endonuclease Cas1 [Acidocella sp.]|uniref:CRISPR-associated endonuclease Cas1 n=1 Tax=Acidocella sp. TaxID=50710 RepID=UPI00261851DB|nr:CRISPR-associated endonuclease Cas1 [Acidocella sp.]
MPNCGTDEAAQAPPNRMHVDASDWSGRASFWKNSKPERKRGVGRPKAEILPLILSGHGIKMRVNHGALEIQNGFTHYPQTREQWRVFPGETDLLSRIILLDGSGAITLDVLSWLATQNIPLIHIDYRGRVIASIGNNLAGTDPNLRCLQFDLSKNQKRSMQVGAWIIHRKITRALDVVERNFLPSKAKNDALAQLHRDAAILKRGWSGSIDELLGVEGRCALLYFRAWRGLPLTWTGTGRKPIPETWKAVGFRRAKRNDGNQFARHPVQAMLNYAYAVLESQVRIEVANLGLDPSIGFLHRSLEGRSALLLDLVEPLRPSVDEVILRFVTGRSFTPSDFTLSTDGVCRLHPELARRIVTEVDELQEIRPLLADFLGVLGHSPLAAIRHKSKG